MRFMRAILHAKLTLPSGSATAGTGSFFGSATAGTGSCLVERVFGSVVPKVKVGLSFLASEVVVDDVSEKVGFGKVIAAGATLFLELSPELEPKLNVGADELETTGAEKLNVGADVVSFSLFALSSILASVDVPNENPDFGGDFASIVLAGDESIGMTGAGEDTAFVFGRDVFTKGGLVKSILFALSGVGCSLSSGLCRCATDSVPLNAAEDRFFELPRVIVCANLDGEPRSFAGPSRNRDRVRFITESGLVLASFSRS